MKHKRFFFPVGQGGFSLEKIGDFVVVYDCGTITSTDILEEYIDSLREDIAGIDILFISHFDKDHVNGIRYLLNNIRVKQAITTFIPDSLKTVYGLYTNGAYQDILNLLYENDVNISEIGNTNSETGYFSYQAIWEWIAKSMMSSNDFMKIKKKLSVAGVDLNKLQDADYIETMKVIINNVFKTVFGAKGPNAKGLIMLSQPCMNTRTSGSNIVRGGRYCIHFRDLDHCDESSCLYVGDSDLKNLSGKKDVKSFLQKHMSEGLLFMQIPHHGSQSNIGVHFEHDYQAQYYILNDKDTKRLQKTHNVFKSLTHQKKVLVTRALCCNLIMSETTIV